MVASHSLSGDRSVEPMAPKMRCWRSSASRHRLPSTARSRRPWSAPRWPRRDWRIWRYTAAASSGRPSRRASSARRKSSVVAASSATGPGAAPKFSRLLSVMPRDRSERRGLEPLFGNRLAAPLARTEPAVVQLLQSRDDVAQQPAVAVAQLEEEFSRVRRVRLVAEVLDGIVFLVFSIEGGSPDLFGQLSLLLDELLFEVCEPILAHLDLLPHHPGAP